MREKRASFGEEETATCGVFVCLYLKEEIHRYNGRPPVLLRGPMFHTQARVSPVPFEILGRTLQV